MDTYLEYIIKPKHTPKQLVLTILIFLLATVLAAATFMISFMEPLVMQFMFALIVAYYVGAWYLTRKFNVEYEYIVTNDELDVDKITAKSTRKRMLTVSSRKFDYFGKAEGHQFEKFLKDPGIQVKFDASKGKNSEGRYYAVFENKLSQKMLLIFNPTSKMLDAFKRYNPSVVVLDD